MTAKCKKCLRTMVKGVIEITECRWCKYSETESTRNAIKNGKICVNCPEELTGLASKYCSNKCSRDSFEKKK